MQELRPLFEKAYTEIENRKQMKMAEIAARFHVTEEDGLEEKMLKEAKQKLQEIQRTLPFKTGDKATFTNLRREAETIFAKLGVPMWVHVDETGNLVSVFGKAESTFADELDTPLTQDSDEQLAQREAAFEKTETERKAFEKAATTFLTRYKSMWAGEGYLGISVDEARKEFSTALHSYAVAWRDAMGTKDVYDMAAFYQRTLLPVLEEQKRIQESDSVLIDAPKRRTKLWQSVLRFSVFLLTFGTATAYAPNAGVQGATTASSSENGMALPYDPYQPSLEGVDTLIEELLNEDGTLPGIPELPPQSLGSDEGLEPADAPNMPQEP